MKSCLIFILVCLSFVFALAQSTRTIQGFIHESGSKKPVSYASILIPHTVYGTTTDVKGVFNLQIDSTVTQLIISKIGFETKVVDVTNLKQVDISLKTKIIELKTATVSADEAKPITRNKGLSIVDYDFWNVDTLLIIACRNLPSKSKLYLLTDSGDTLSRILIPEKPERLFTDCINNHYIVCENSYYEIYRDEDGDLQLYPPQNISDFKKVKEPCAASIDSLFIYSIQSGSSTQDMEWFKFKTNNYLQQYYAWDEEHKSQKLMTSIADNQLIRQLFEEKQRVRENFRNGLYRSAFDAEIDFYFAHKMLFKKVYAPLFRIENQFYIFNFAESILQQYSSNADLLNNTPLNFGNEQSFNNLIIKDAFTEKLYAIYGKSTKTTIHEIDLINADLKEGFNVARPFAENFKINNKQLYFIYKDYRNNDEVAVLYRQIIKN